MLGILKLFISSTNIDSLDFSCRRSHTLCGIEDILEMEATTRKFEIEGEILEESISKLKGVIPCIHILYQMCLIELRMMDILLSAKLNLR